MQKRGRDLEGKTCQCDSQVLLILPYRNGRLGQERFAIGIARLHRLLENVTQSRLLNVRK